MLKALLGFLLVCSPLASAQQRGASLATAMPEGAMSYVETTGLSELIRRVGDSEVFQSVMASDDWKDWEKTHIISEFNKSRKLVEFLLRMDIWEACDKLLGGRLAVATYATSVGEDPDFSFIIKPSESSEWLTNRIRYAPLVRVGVKRVDRKDYGELVSAYRTRGNEEKATYFALHADWIAIASSTTLLRHTVALQVPGGLSFGAPAPLGAEPAFRSMTARMGEQHLARAFLNTKRIADVTGENLGLGDDIGDPVLALFLGGVIELLDKSRFASFTLDYGDKEIVFKAGIDARPEEMAEGHRLFFSAGPSDGLPAPPEVPGYIGGFSLYRPFSDWYRKRDQAVQGTLVPGLEGFEGNVGDLLLGSGGVIGDRVAFVSAHADDGGADPSDIALPGFAFVVDLKNPEMADVALGPLFESTLAEIDGGREGLAAWELVADEHAGVPVNYARRPGDTMAPAAARVGDRWVLSSSRSLCGRVIDTLIAGENELADRDLAFDLRFTELSKFFAANQVEYEAEFVRRGRTPTQAKADYANITKLMTGMRSLSGQSSSAEGEFQFTAKGVFR